MASYIHNLSNV